jgi:hypothetical protein
MRLRAILNLLARSCMKRRLNDCEREPGRRRARAGASSIEAGGMGAPGSNAKHGGGHGGCKGCEDLSESREYFVVEVVHVHACKIRRARRPIRGELRSAGACLLRVRQKDAAMGACTAALSTGGSVYPVPLLFVGVKLQPTMNRTLQGIGMGANYWGARRR